MSVYPHAYKFNGSGVLPSGHLMGGIIFQSLIHGKPDN